MTDKIVVYDIDDTLGSFNDCMIKKVQIEYPNVTWDNINQVFGDQFLHIAETLRVLEDIPPFEYAKTALEEACASGTVHIVTARGWHPNGLRVTEDWFERHDLPYHHIHVVGLDVVKADYIKENIGRVDVAIDDNAFQLERMIGCGNITKTLIKDAVWNRHIDGHRVKCLSEVKGHIG